MIPLIALAASLFARRFTPQSEWKLWVASAARLPGWPAPIIAPLAGSLFIAEILFGTLMLASAWAGGDLGGDRPAVDAVS